MRTYALALIAALAIEPCRAEEQSIGAIPQFDIEQRCANRPDKVETGLCLTQERASYDTLKTLWDTLSEKTKVTCTDMSKNNKYLGYSVLLECAITRH